MFAFLLELFRFGLYKRTQGRIARQTTFYTIGVVIAYAAFRLSEIVPTMFTEKSLPEGMPLIIGIASGAVLFVLGVWTAFRLVNFPTFADFLIAVEAEMNKVSWPSRTELYRASVVVLVVMVIMSFSIFGFDLVLEFLARNIGIRA